ncbi:Cysteine--tRNA ligase 2, cytoplasmic [Linum perenne]
MAVGSEVEKKMEFRLYNTMSKTVEVFKPIVPGKVGMYVCGVTAYDLSHIGHARAAVVFDVLFRYLQHLGYEVTYVRNFTDIDDKIIKRANDLNEDPFSLSNRFCEEYLLDMGKLQCLPPTYQPRVTEHMDNIKNMITQIVQNGCGYAVEGDVFFAVEKSPNYGQLSGRKLEDNRAGERVAVDLRKRNPADFALWKAAKEHEPRWDSSWGPGRPGWHIECSAMSAHYLSFKFDIHGGGSDLIFPHHENEVAQSGAACSESKINYWIHNGHVTNNHLKMSKSLGNFFTIRQIIEKYHPLALRMFLISAHYRSPLNYSIGQIEKASDTVSYIYQTLHDCEVALLPFQESLKEAGSTKTEKKDKTIQKAQECITSLQNDFEAKMSEDLNTSHVLTGAFHEALKFLNANLSPPKKKQQKQQLTSLPRYLAELANEIERVLRILGLLPTCSYSEVLQQLKEKALIRAELEEDDVARLIEDRKAARKNKEFARSDEIRADLAKKGIALMDVGTETVWRPCVPVVQEEDVAVAAVEAVGLQEQSSSKSSVPS